MKETLNVIGGGLAGVEAAWQAAELGAKVKLYEMRPVQQTPAHRTDKLAEIVCSNSLKTDEPGSAPYLLKEELRRGNSLVMEAAAATKVPAGAALSVDRIKFAELITERVAAHPNIEIVREEFTKIDADEVTIICTGPLTSDALTQEIMKFTGDDQLYFYDAIAPIIAAESIDMSIAFKAARYDKGGDDYINCPMARGQYETFVAEVLAAKPVPIKRFEDTQWFESCLPIEEIARRGPETLRFGPMKPKGLRDPKTGEEPYACVQLRQENLMADAYGMVGFQNHLKYGEQGRVLRLIPGLENAEFLQYGQIHRNTFINSPTILNETLVTKANPNLFFAGQITGVGLRRIHRHRLAGGNQRRAGSSRPAADHGPANLGDRCSLPLRLERRNEKLPTREHNLRTIRAAAHRAPKKISQQARTARRAGGTGVERLGRVDR
jgi:methylenetetrahydrofolate--tRNA-(uracil-5-)-methyltransferase